MMPKSNIVMLKLPAYLHVIYVSFCEVKGKSESSELWFRIHLKLSLKTIMEDRVTGA